MTAPDRQTHLVAVVVFALAAAIVLSRLHTYDEPFERDITATAVISSELRAGKSLYSEVWENKPPGLYVTHYVAQGIAGYGNASIYLLNVMAAVVTLLGVYAAASGPMGVGAGLWAAGFWTVTSGDPLLQANQPNTEVFINAALIWALALVLRRSAGQSALTTIAIGTLIVVATFYKHHTALYGALFAVAHISAPPAPGAPARRQAIRDVAVIATIGAMAWTGFFAYLLATGRFQRAWTTLFVFPRFYSQNMTHNLTTSLTPSLLFPPELYVTLPLVILALAGLVIGALRGPERPWIFFVCYAVATQVTVALSGMFFPHYYQLWLPLLAVGAGWGLRSIAGLFRNSSWMPQALGAVALIGLLATELPPYRLTPEWWSAMKYSDIFVVSERIGRRVDRLLRPDEAVFVLGEEPGIYFASRRRPPTGIFFVHAIKGGPLAVELTSQMITDLTQRRPDLLIIQTNAAARLAPDHQLIRWLTEHYCAIDANARRGLFEACARRGSDLERRLGSVGQSSSSDAAWKRALLER